MKNKGRTERKKRDRVKEKGRIEIVQKGHLGDGIKEVKIHLVFKRMKTIILTR